MGSDADIPLHDSDPEATLPFRAVVAIPGQDETVDAPPAPRLEDPARLETRPDEETPGTLPYGTVLPLGSGGDDDETVDAPPPGAWSQPQKVASSQAPVAAGIGPGSHLGQGFELEAALAQDPLGEWWGGVHPQHGPCLVLALERARAVTEGPRLLIAARVAMEVPPDPRLELPVGTGALPRPWIAFKRQQTSPLDEVLEQGGKRLRPLRWARDLAGGLAALHAYGVAHGEVSLSNARIPTQGAARWSRVGLRTQAGPPEALPPELELGATPTRGADLHAFGAVLARLAEHVAEPWRAKELAQLAQELRADARPSADQVLERLILLSERPGPRAEPRPLLWAFGGALLGAAAGALLTWLLLGAGG